MNVLSGTWIYPKFLATSIILIILLPQTAIFLPYFTAELHICWTLCTLDANVATTILFLQFINNLSNTSPTELSDIVYPFLSEFVLSDNNAKTPLFPISAILPKSINWSSIGVKSILKSPVCITVPTGVWIASITESGILCELLINSTWIFPKLTVWPWSTMCNLVLRNNLCSSNLFWIKPTVNLVA